MNFGSWQQQLSRAGATVIFAQFGQMECFQGKGSLPEFVRAYEKLLEQFHRHSSRIVLLSPTPFEKPPSPLPDLSVRNEDLRLFVEATRDLARKRGYAFVDLFTSLLPTSNPGLRLTENGLQLGPTGHWAVASETVRQLGLSNENPMVQFQAASDTLRPESAERLRKIVQAKNRLWFDYWRPMNWAFLYGDRTEQPSSRDHHNPAVRWFPEEMQKFIPLIEAKEKELNTVAQNARN